VYTSASGPFRVVGTMSSTGNQDAGENCCRRYEDFNTTPTDRSEQNWKTGVHCLRMASAQSATPALRGLRVPGITWAMRGLAIRPRAAARSRASPGPVSAAAAKNRCWPRSPKPQCADHCHALIRRRNQDGQVQTRAPVFRSPTPLLLLATAAALLPLATLLRHPVSVPRLVA
jgi:hypothetical protein